MTIFQEEFRLDIKLVMITQNKQSRRVKRLGSPSFLQYFFIGESMFSFSFILKILILQKKKKDLAKRKMAKYNNGYVQAGVTPPAQS